MSLVGIGTDLLRTSRIAGIVTGSSKRLDRFVTRVLHKVEIERFHKINAEDVSSKTRFLASSWSSKEALYKSLDEERQRQFEMKHWYRASSGGKDQKGHRHEILSDSLKYPNEKFWLSISHDGDYTSAFVVRTMDNHKPS